MKQPLFSIVTPTYNRGYILWKIIQSVQAQVYPFWEMIIVDDGSTDDTKHLVAEFQHDPRIKYVYQKNSGAAAARNHGLELAQGDFITYIDSDDSVYPIYLSTALEFFKKNSDKIFATCNYNRRLEFYDENYQLLDFIKSSSAQKSEVNLQDFYYWQVRTCGTGTFHTRQVITDGIRWDSNFKVLEDLDFILALGLKYPSGHFHIAYVLFEYLQKYGADGLCSQVSYADWAKAFEKIYVKHKKTPLMAGQNWYPKKIDEYLELQKQVDAGLIPPAMYKYFPQYYKLLKNS